MKIYTKGGDKGQTSLVGGSRVSKTHVRIEAYGTVDELNAWIGLLGDCPESEGYREKLTQIQDRLFTIGSNLALEEPGKFNIPKLKEVDVQNLESWIDDWEQGLEPMRNFVLPGGAQIVSFIHIARTVCRRAERQLIRMMEEVEVEGHILKYLNRLSDLLFVFSRRISHDIGAEERPWQPNKA